MKKKLLRVTLMAMFMVLAVKTTMAQTRLSFGDIAIFYVQADAPDDFAFVTFVDIEAGTVIYFTDCGADWFGFARPCMEGALQYTIPTGGLTAGDIVRYSTSGSDFQAYQDSRITSSFALSSAGDQVIAFQDASSSGGSGNAGNNPAFIFAVNMASTAFSGRKDDTNQTGLPTNLSNTSTPRTALGLGSGPGVEDEWDNAVYNGSYDFSGSGLEGAKLAMTDRGNFSFSNEIIEPAYASAKAAIPSALTLTVTDTSPPEVQSIAPQGSPAANATSVQFLVTFDEVANNITADDFTVTTTAGTASGSVSTVSASMGSSVTITVGSISGTGEIRLDLKASTDITDNNGNGDGTNGHVPAFVGGDRHTVDRDNPTFVSSIPAHGDTGVATGSNISISFSENIAFGSGDIRIIDLDDGSGTVTINAASPGAQASINSRTLNLTPAAALEEQTNYAIRIAPTAIEDVAGNRYSGINNNITLNFTTADETAPTLLSNVPADDATGVTTGDNITLTFSEPIAFGTGTIQLVDLDDGSGTLTIDAASPGAEASVSSSTLTIDPGAGLETGTNYAVRIAATAIKDLNDINFAGISDNSTFNFTTVNLSSISINDPSVAEGDAGTTTLTYTVTLSPSNSGAVTVNYETMDGTAVAGSDYTAIASTLLTFNPGETTKTVDLVINGDKMLESDETILVKLSNLTGNNVIIANDTGTGTITNDDAAAVTLADVSGNEDDGAITVTAVLDNAVQGGFTVEVSTADGTAAVADNDYTPVSGRLLTFNGAAGEMRTFTVTPTADTKLEADEMLTVSQSNLAATTLPVDITDGATITISNDDAATVTLADVSGDEDDGAITVTAVLDNAVQGGFTVEVSTADGTATVADNDYRAITGVVLTFSGTAGEMQTFTVTPTADTKLEADETLTVSQGNLAATTLAVNITDGATVTIVNDDAAAVTLADASGREDGGAITVTPTLDNAVQGGFTVEVSTADGTATLADNDYTAVTGEVLSFNGIAGETQTFTITPNADDKEEPDENVTVRMDVLGGTTLAIDISDEATVVFINDDNAPVIQAGQSFTIDENTNTTLGWVVATDVDAGTVFQDWKLISGNIDVNGDGNLPFLINTNTGELSVNDAGDLDFESGTTSFNLTVTVSDGTNTSMVETVVINLKDVNDVVPVITAGQSFDLEENTANASVVGTVEATDGDATPTIFGNWTIAGGNESGVFAIDPDTGELTVKDNTNLDRERFAGFTLILTVDDGVNVSAPEEVSIKVIDLNDEVPVITPGQIFTVSENAPDGTAVGTVMATDADVTVTIFSNWSIINGDDHGLFNIDPNLGQITIADNTSLDFESLAAYSLEITVSDGVNTSAATPVSIQVIDEDEKPSISGLADLEADEDNPVVTTFTVSDPDTDLSALTFSFKVNNTEVFDVPDIVVTGEGPNRTLTITPLSDQYGVTVVEIAVSDQTSTFTVSFNVTIHPVNDAPVSIALSNHTIDENTAPGTVVGLFSTTDVDDLTHTYSLVNGEGDDDNGAFAITAAELVTSEALNPADGRTLSVRVRSTDAAGAFKEESFEITLRATSESTLEFNTAFTPNGDGVNDTWNIQNIQLHPNARVSIFNGNGKVVFESVGYEVPWDGTFEGKELPPDTYYYLIDLGNNRRYKGYVLILK